MKKTTRKRHPALPDWYILREDMEEYVCENIAAASYRTLFLVYKLLEGDTVEQCKEVEQCK